MAGMKGRSGGRRRGAGRPSLSADVHRLRGTYRPDRHGPRVIGATAAAIVPIAAPSPVEKPDETPTDAPTHLEPATLMWAEYILTNWTLDEHHARLLQLACEAWDTSQRAHAIVAVEGMTVPTAAGGCKAHPLLAVAAAARAQFASLIAQLNLEDVGKPGA